MKTAVYAIAHIQVKDFKRYFTEYAEKFNEILGDYEAEVLAASKEVDIIEGERFGNWTVLMKFPSREQAFTCIESDDYAPLAKVRIEELTTGGNVMFVPAVDKK